jgi:glycosyltransferase 2 family protein
MIQKVFIDKKAIKSMKWKTVKRYLPIFGIGLFIYLLIKLDVTKIFSEFSNIIWSYVALSAAFILIYFFFQTLKWFILAKSQKINILFSEAFRINFISNFYGFITPGKIGTAIRADYLKKKGTETGKGVSNFVIDKVLDFCSLFILLIGFGFIIYKKIIPNGEWFILIGAFVLLITLSIVFYNKNSSRFLLKGIYKKFIPSRLKEKSKVLFNSFYEDMPSASFLFLALIFNLIAWVINYVSTYLIGLSLGINVSFTYFLIILPIATLIAQIPITINGFGTRELTLIGLFGVLGISATKIFSMSILGMIIANVIPSIIAIIMILCERKNEIHSI